MRLLQRARSSGQPLSPRQIEDLRASLSLPGVKEEIEALRGILHGNTLLDAQFTVGQLHQQAESGDYRIVHIASHGVFGGSAETSFILAYDDLITMNGLQGLLKAEKLQSTPIELLSLSACETAEGNDRAPLGISGAAIKARARSVLGTLWPVADDAAKGAHEEFLRRHRQCPFVQDRSPAPGTTRIDPPPRVESSLLLGAIRHHRELAVRKTMPMPCKPHWQSVTALLAAAFCALPAQAASNIVRDGSIGAGRRWR
jgi:hypothetical protein